jgi:hypothetical protein
MTQHIALQPQRRRASLNSTALVAIVAVAVALVVAGAAWFVLVKPSASGTPSTAATSTSGAHAATVGGLVAASDSLGHPIYWAGKRAGITYELTLTKSGNAYVRYLTAGAKPGDKRPNFVTVGTYPQVDAYQVLTAAHKIKNARIQTLAGGELAVSYPTRPKSVYVAKPGSRYMVEVFAPVSRGAETLVRNGLIVPVK